MGKRHGWKRIFVRVLQVLFFLPILCIIIYNIYVIILDIVIPKELVITNINLTENNMIIEIKNRRARGDYTDYIVIEYKNIPRGISFRAQIEKEFGDNFYRTSMETLTLDLSNVSIGVFEKEDDLLDVKRIFIYDILYINEEARLSIPLSLGELSADIFIREDGVDILGQNYSGELIK